MQIRELSVLITSSDRLLSNSCYLCTQLNQVHVDLEQMLANALGMYNHLSRFLKKDRTSI